MNIRDVTDGICLLLAGSLLVLVWTVILTVALDLRRRP
jgi:hypothetical protein